MPVEYAETGRVTADAYREFVKPGEAEWEAYLVAVSDVDERARRATILVASQEGTIVGSATLELNDRVDPDEDPPLRPGEAHIRMLGVDPRWRGRGIAGHLMGTCEDRARAAGRTLMTLHTTQRMKAAQAMYEGLGYVRGEDRVLDGGFVLLSYSKPLDTEG